MAAFISSPYPSRKSPQAAPISRARMASPSRVTQHDTTHQSPSLERAAWFWDACVATALSCRRAATGSARPGTLLSLHTGLGRLLAAHLIEPHHLLPASGSIPLPHQRGPTAIAMTPCPLLLREVVVHRADQQAQVAHRAVRCAPGLLGNLAGVSGSAGCASIPSSRPPITRNCCAIAPRAGL